MCSAVADPFEEGSSGESGRLALDQFLIQAFGRDADAVGDIGQFEFSRQVAQGNLV